MDTCPCLLQSLFLYARVQTKTSGLLRSHLLLSVQIFFNHYSSSKESTLILALCNILSFSQLKGCLDPYYMGNLLEISLFTIYTLKAIVYTLDTGIQGSIGFYSFCISHCWWLLMNLSDHSQNNVVLQLEKIVFFSKMYWMCYVVGKVYYIASFSPCANTSIFPIWLLFFLLTHHICYFQSHTPTHTVSVTSSYSFSELIWNVDSKDSYKLIFSVFLTSIRLLVVCRYADTSGNCEQAPYYQKVTTK